MHVTFAPRGILQIDDARITFRNFSGIGSKFNREGDRSFALVIDNQEIADALLADTNEFGAAWNVKIRHQDEDTPFMYMNVKVKFNGRGPAIYLKTGDVMNKLDESNVSMLDKIDIASVDLDIRPYDDEFNGRGFRSAYLQSMCVTQDLLTDRFANRFRSEEY